jgi:hypothetical protein
MLWHLCREFEAGFSNSFLRHFSLPNPSCPALPLLFHQGSRFAPLIWSLRLRGAVRRLTLSSSRHHPVSLGASSSCVAISLSVESGCASSLGSVLALECGVFCLHLVVSGVTPL